MTKCTNIALTWISQTGEAARWLSRTLIHVVARHRQKTKVGKHTLGDVNRKGAPMNGLIYLVGLVVIVLFVLGFLGLR